MEDRNVLYIRIGQLYAANCDQQTMIHEMVQQIRDLEAQLAHYKERPDVPRVKNFGEEELHAAS